ncbi:uncharacterized protein LOC125579020 [Brassica napus]|uniref:uncharacterized protein LOC125579020 n=1 Tax=Brassica napus TaxID=3708 RepID=UPI002078E7EC|nr:uncharacterized protein LOC125579020 [Brassica napus]
MKTLQPRRSVSVALLLLMLAFFNSKIHTEGHIVLRDLEISMEKSLGDSLLRISRSRYSPINNKRNPSKKHKITSR